MLSVMHIVSFAHDILCLSLATPQVPAATSVLAVAFDGAENLGRKLYSTCLLQGSGPLSF